MARMVDRLQSFKGWIVEGLTPQRVVFHHVPKCGGTSVGRALRMKYLLSQATVNPEESFRAFESFTGRRDREQMLIDVLDLREQFFLYFLHSDIHCIALHVRFSDAAHAGFSEKYKFITILREPVSRFISHYFWSHGKPHAHARIDEDFESFLRTDRARRLGATYVEYFAGLPKKADITTPEAVARAVLNLRKFNVVGQLNNLDEFQQALRRELGARVRIGHENKARQPGSLRQTVLTDANLDRVRALCTPDLAVWNQFFGAEI